MQQRVVSEGRMLLRTAVAGVSVLCILLSSAVPAIADLNTSLYSKKNDCETESDPVGIVFYGAGAAGGWESAVWHTQEHAGWNQSSGTNQTNISHFFCYNMAAQRANGGLLNDRFHVRFFRAHDQDGRQYTAATPHYEEITSCGHAVVENTSRHGSGFTKAKRRLRDRMHESGHHFSYDAWWGNTRSFRQCNLKYASGNGYVWFIHIP